MYSKDYYRRIATEDGILPWIIPAETVAQVYADFRQYLGR